MTTVTIYDWVKAMYKPMNKNPFSGEFIKAVTNYNTQIKLLMDTEVIPFCLENEEANDYIKRAFLNLFLNREIKFQSVDIFKAKASGILMRHDKQISNIFEQYLDIMDDGYTSETNTKGHTQGQASSTASGTSTSKSDNTNKSQSNTNNDNTNNNKNRSIVQTLPQTQVNIDIDNYSFPYADQISGNNAINDSQSNTTSTGTGESHSTGNNTTTSQSNANNINDQTGNSQTTMSKHNLSNFTQFQNYVDIILEEMRYNLLLNIW